MVRAHEYAQRSASLQLHAHEVMDAAVGVLGFPQAESDLAALVVLGALRGEDADQILTVPCLPEAVGPHARRDELLIVLGIGGGVVEVVGLRLLPGVRDGAGGVEGHGAEAKSSGPGVVTHEVDVPRGGPSVGEASCPSAS